MKKIVVLSEYKHTPNNWSGTGYYLPNYLSEKFEIIYSEIRFSFIIKFLEKVAHKLLHRRKLLIFYKLRLYKVRHKVKKYLKSGIDTFFLPAGANLINSYSFPPEAKVILLVDATYYILNNYYFVEKENDSKIGYLIDKKAFDRSDYIISASDWATSSIINDFNIPSKKVKTIPLPSYLDDQYAKNSEHSNNKIKLLLIGLDYYRKGVDIAIRCLQTLNKDRNRFELNIVGANNINDVQDSNIHFWGKLNKDNPNELKQLIDLYNSSDIFILPTQKECAGIVFSESAQYGLPIVTSNTGGVPSYVKNGFNGYLIDLKKSNLEYQFAKAINDIVENKLELFSKNSRCLYEKQLNKETWLNEFISFIFGGK